MKFFLCFWIITTLFSCSSSSYLKPSYEEVADRITEKTAKKMEIEKKLILCGTGGQMMHDVQMLMMAFEYFEITNIDTARELLVAIAQEYLSAINSSEELRPHLHTSPFTAQNIEIVIYFYSRVRSEVPSDTISVAEINRDKLIYYINEPKTHNLKKLFEETYEDALKTVDSRQNLSIGSKL